MSICTPSRDMSLEDTERYNQGREQFDQYTKESRLLWDQWWQLYKKDSDAYSESQQAS
jgi:hypothetical protein